MEGSTGRAERGSVAATSKPTPPSCIRRENIGSNHQFQKFGVSQQPWLTDGTRIAIIKTRGNHVYVLPLDGSPVRDLASCQLILTAITAGASRVALVSPTGKPYMSNYNSIAIFA
jgi:hypothetical protein